jgi:hypothetical protein
MNHCRMSEKTRPWLAVSLVTLLVATTVQGSQQVLDLKVFNGEWIYVEDKTEGRTLEQLGPPMSSKFVFGSENGAIILVSGHGSGLRNVRVSLDGTITEAMDGTTTVKYQGSWKDGVLTYQSDYFRGPEMKADGYIRKTFKLAADGLMVGVSSNRTEGMESVALYKHPQDIPMPTPIKSTINDLAWLAGAWTGTRGTGGAISMEERWSPPKGGSMLAISRTVSRERTSAFEYLRILERDGGLVYVAQPNGGLATEFIMTEFSSTRAVFDNPRHDYPKRITYELSSNGGLTATIGYLKGGFPRRYEFKKEGG